MESTAPAKLSLGSILALIVAWGPKIPQMIALLNAFIDLLGLPPANSPTLAGEGGTGGAGGLELQQLDHEETQLVEQIQQELSNASDGRQQVFDLSRIRSLAKFLNENSGKLAAFLALFGR